MLEKCVEQLFNVLPAILCVVVGYWMGWKSARPEDPLVKRTVDQGPTDEPEGDIWTDAMKDPESEERVKTI